MKLFQEPDLNIHDIEVKDVITTSQEGGSPDEGGGGGWGN